MFRTGPYPADTKLDIGVPSAPHTTLRIWPQHPFLRQMAGSKQPRCPLGTLQSYPRVRHASPRSRVKSGEMSCTPLSLSQPSSSSSIPCGLGDMSSSADKPAQLTRTLPSGEEAAVFARMVCRSLYSRQGPRQSVPIWSSLP